MWHCTRHRHFAGLPNCIVQTLTTHRCSECAKKHVCLDCGSAFSNSQLYSNAPTRPSGASGPLSVLYSDLTSQRTGIADEHRLSSGNLSCSISTSQPFELLTAIGTSCVVNLCIVLYRALCHQALVLLEGCKTTFRLCLYLLNDPASVAFNTCSCLLYMHVHTNDSSQCSGFVMAVLWMALELP